MYTITCIGNTVLMQFKLTFVCNAGKTREGWEDCGREMSRPDRPSCQVHILYFLPYFSF